MGFIREGATEAGRTEWAIVSKGRRAAGGASHSWREERPGFCWRRKVRTVGDLIFRGAFCDCDGFGADSRTIFRNGIDGRLRKFGVVCRRLGRAQERSRVGGGIVSRRRVAAMGCRRQQQEGDRWTDSSSAVHAARAAHFARRTGNIRGQLDFSRALARFGNASKADAEVLEVRSVHLYSD